MNRRAKHHHLRTFHFDVLQSIAYMPQHFLYFFPLPHGQGSLRPIFFSTLLVAVGFNNNSKSAISSGLSGSSPMVNFQPFSVNMAATSVILSSVWTLTIAGLFSVPNFAVFVPPNIFAMCSPFYRFFKITDQDLSSFSAMDLFSE